MNGGTNVPAGRDNRALCFGTLDRCLAQRWGGPIETIRAGDVVWFPPGEKHWHGASPETAMTHIAIQEALGGKTVEWLEKVSDEQYTGRK